MRIVLASLAFIAFAAPAAAQPASGSTPNVLDQVYACANVGDENERLRCYDGAVGRLREAQTSGNLVAVDRAAAQEIEREAFGFSLPNLPRLFGGGSAEEQLSEIQVQIEEVERPQGRGAIFHLSNGQVWVQADNLATRHARTGRTVTIRSGAMGGFMMSFEGGGAALRVRRQQ